MRPLLLLAFSLMQAQPPQNTNFESGSFYNWKTMIADSNNVLLETEPVPNRHEIVENYSDPWTNNSIASVTEGTFSAKLGNDTAGVQAEAIETRFFADTDQLIIYRYAVVLDDPWHEELYRPKLQAELLGEHLENVCFQHTIQLNDSLGPLQVAEINGHSIRYSNWRAGAFEPETAGYTALRFTTTDCGLGGHFAYAYLEAALINKNNTISFCDKEALHIKAPDGFQNYLWSNGRNEQEIAVHPRDGDMYQCKLIPDFGCPVSINYQLIKIQEVDCRTGANFFTPNNDGINDFWQPDWRPGDLYCQIFDQNGKLLTKIDFLENWDGSIGGIPCKQADYWFEIISTTAPRRNHFSLVKH